MARTARLGWFGTRPTRTVSRWQAAGLAWVAVAVVLLFTNGWNTDFDFLWYSARFLLEGTNPYLRAHEISYWPLYYPLPAVLVAVPFALPPLTVARYLWQLVVAGAFAWAMSGRGLWAMLAMASGAFLSAIVNGQSTPLMVAAVLIPALGFVLPMKPTSAIAPWLAYPTRVAAYGALAMLAVSLAVMPHWPADWWKSIHEGSSYIVPPITRPFGWVLLLAALRWRDPRGRLILGLALAPQNLFLHETVALALVPRNFRQMSLYVVGTWIVLIASTQIQRPNSVDLNPQILALWPWSLACIYLPMLWLVLRQSAVNQDDKPPLDRDAMTDEQRVRDVHHRFAEKKGEQQSPRSRIRRFFGLR